MLLKNILKEYLNINHLIPVNLLLRINKIINLNFKAESTHSYSSIKKLLVNLKLVLCFKILFKG